MSSDSNKQIIFDINLYLKKWNERISEIKNQPMDIDTLKRIYDTYYHEAELIRPYLDIQKDTQNLMNLTMDLIIAIQFSYSKYREQQSIIWKLFKGKGLQLPPISYKYN